METLQECADRVVRDIRTRWSHEPTHLSNVVALSIEATIRNEVERKVSEMLVDETRPIINRVITACIDRWLERGEIVPIIQPPHAAKGAIRNFLKRTDSDSFLAALDLRCLEMILLRRNGLTLKQIGKRFGISGNRVRQLTTKKITAPMQSVLNVIVRCTAELAKDQP